MQVELQAFSLLGHDGTTRKVIVELAEGATVRDLLAASQIPMDDVGILVVNRKSAVFDQTLSEGDSVTVIPHIGGG